MDNIQRAVEQYCDTMHKLGYSAKRLATDSAILSKLVFWHESKGLTVFEPGIVNEYIDKVQKMLDNDKIGHYIAQQQIYTIKKFQLFITTGEVRADRLLFPITPLNSEFDTIIERYVSCFASNNQQRKSRAWAPKRYANWLLNHGISSFSGATIYDLRQYLIDDMKLLKSKTIPTLRSAMRRFQRWLYDNSYSDGHYEELFDFRICVENKIHPAALPDDVSKVLSLVDRNTIIGKRDYAVFMLSTVLGLRGCDIINLKLVDIDWRQGEIRITQRKTRKPLALPLTTDVAVALQDYILHGRHKCESSYVFIRILPPYINYSHSSGLGNAYTDYMRKAGIEGEGGLYSLRRALGRNMVIAETPVTTVAQVLGHTDIENTKQYISLDTKHLKVCALSFDGIMPRRWSH